MKKVLTALALCASFALAEVADPTLYTSGASEPETPVVNVNHVDSDEPVFAVSIHPISMLVLSLFDVPSVYLTIEGNLGSRMSLITRPHIIWKEFSDSDETLDIFIFGISEGLRYYFGGGHRGFFATAHFMYERASLDYTYKYDIREDESASANGFGGGFYIGHKLISGHFTSSFDVGFTYIKYSASSEEKDDIEDVSSVGVGWDINYTIGFTF